MAIVKTHPKGQIILPKDPIEFLTGILKDHPSSMARELLEERRRDDKIDETNSL